MADNVTIGSRTLLAQAAAIYDAPDSPLPRAGRAAVLGGFAAGAEWMGQALSLLRGEARAGPTTVTRWRWQWLGVVKYGLASVVALAGVLLALGIGLPVLALAGVPLFYAVESQAVFLFPLVLDGHGKPFREARRWTVRAGGTWRVMAVVIPIAATMLAGGFVGRGFVRSWCLGCLAVCLWYEQLRKAA